jgi:hypothetical protein
MDSTVKKSLAHLASLARQQNIPEFASACKKLLLQDFDGTLEFLRVQKTINKIRDAALIDKYRVTLDEWLRFAPISGGRKSRLKRHLDICYAIQEIFDEIDKMSAPLRLWTLPTQKIIQCILSEVEKRYFEFRKRDFGSAEPKSYIHELRLTEFTRRDLRRFCDYAALLLNQIPTHNVSTKMEPELSDEDVQQAFALARLADLILDIFNVYSYKNVPILVRGKQLRVVARVDDLEKALTWPTLRERSYEINYYYSLNEKLEKLARDFVVSVGSTAERDFERFLFSQSGETLWKESEFILHALESTVSGELRGLIELDLPFNTKHGKFTSSELIRTWAVLFHLAFCVDVWQKATNNPIAPILSNNMLNKLIAAGVTEVKEQVDSLIAQFSLNTAIRNQDPFYRPIIKLDDSYSLLARTFVETGRFSRNLLTIAVAESDLDLSPKGLRPLKGLPELFARAGFVARLSVPLHDGQRLLTDVDIVAHKDGFLFLGQVKVLIQPDSLYEEWKARQTLRQAAKQLEVCVEHATNLAILLGIPQPLVRVVPFILTNIWDFTAVSISRFKVIDFSYLANLLTGAQIGFVRSQPQPEQHLRSFIKGQYPTPEELEKLILNPIHGSLSEQQHTTERKEFTVAGWQISIPVWQHPLDSRLKAGAHRSLRE